MLIKLGNNWVIADKYEIQGKDRFSFLYSNGDKHLIIHCEDLKNPYRLLIYINRIKEWVEPKGRIISSEEKEEIGKNLKEGWAFLDVPTEFE